MLRTAGLRACVLGLAAAFAGVIALQAPANAAISQQTEAASPSVVAGCHGKHCKRAKKHCGHHCKPGPRGPQGPKGDPGISGYEVISEEFTPDPSSFEGHVVPCPTGKVVLGGGVETPSFALDTAIIGSAPSRTPVGWAGSFATGAIPSTYRIYAICAFKK